MIVSIEVATSWNLLNTAITGSTAAQLQAQYGYALCLDITYALGLWSTQCSLVSIKPSTTTNATMYNSPGITITLQLYGPDSNTLYAALASLQSQAQVPANSKLSTGFAASSISTSSKAVTLDVAPTTPSTPSTPSSSSSSSMLSTEYIIIIAAGGGVLLLAIIIAAVYFVKKSSGANANTRRMQEMSTLA
jgi:hypothetical protein